MSLRVPALPHPGRLELPESAPRRRGGAAIPRPATGSAQAGLIGLVACTAVISLCAAGTPSLLPETVRPIPRWLAGPFGDLGVRLPFLVLALLLGGMFLGYLTAARRAERVSTRTLLMAIAALHAIVLLAPPIISTDLFSYQAYARMGAVYGANPYLHGPSTIALDPLYPYIGSRWVSTPTVYGPIFTLFSYVLAPLSIALTTLTYKAIAAVGSLITVALVWHAARLRGTDERRAVALVGLNPLVILYGVGGGHNDLMMLTVMTAGVYLVLAGRERRGAGSVVLAAGIKLSAGLLLPFMLAGSRHPAARDRRREILIGAAAAGAAVLALGFALAGPGSLRVLVTLFQNQSKGDWHSISGLISVGLGLNLIGSIIGAVLALGFVGAFGLLLRAVWQGRLDWLRAAGWATFALLLSAGSVLPWYIAWLVPLAALAGDRRLWMATMWTTGVILGMQVLGYIPHGVLIFGP